MTKDEILEKLQDVFRDVFEDDELTIHRASSADDVEGWDSLMHVSLMINVERAFKAKFSTTQVASLKNVGELVDLLESRQAGASGGRHRGVGRARPPVQASGPNLLENFVQFAQHRRQQRHRENILGGDPDRPMRVAHLGGCGVGKAGRRGLDVSGALHQLFTRRS